jgi:hypothetical protein
MEVHMLTETLEKLRIDEHTFFRIAHQARFGHMPNLQRDVIEYKVAGIVPVYVTWYLSHIKEKKHDL